MKPVVASTLPLRHALHPSRGLRQTGARARMRPQSEEYALRTRAQRLPGAVACLHSTSAMACAAMPSPRPVNPSLSVVFALTLTRP